MHFLFHRNFPLPEGNGLHGLRGRWRCFGHLHWCTGMSGPPHWSGLYSASSSDRYFPDLRLPPCVNALFQSHAVHTPSDQSLCAAPSLPFQMLPACDCTPDMPGKPGPSSVLAFPPALWHIHPETSGDCAYLTNADVHAAREYQSGDLPHPAVLPSSPSLH